MRHEESRYASVTFFIEEHPGGNDLGYVVSSNWYENDDEEPSMSESNGDYDNQKEAVDATVERARALMRGGEIGCVEVLLDGSPVEL